MKLPHLNLSKGLSLAILVIVFLFLALLPQFTEGYVVTLLIDIIKFAILTVAWVIFSGPSGYMSLATAAFYGLGFYVAAVFSGTIPFALAVVLAGAMAFLLALLVGALTLRLRGVYFAIFTFGLVELVRHVVREVERVATSTRGRFVETQSTETVYYAIFIVAILTLVVAVLLRRSRYGLALQSVGEHEEAAAHSGINVVRTKVLTFAVSAVFMGMAGAIIATRRTYIDPDIAFNLNHSFLPVMMALFGGMGNLVGPVIGAGVFTYLGEILLTRVPDLYMLTFGVVLVVAILFLPNGILGLAQQIWLVAKGEIPLTRGLFVAVALIPVIGWLIILLYLGRLVWFKIRRRRAYAITVGEPFNRTWLAISVLFPGVGLLTFIWFLCWLGWTTWRGGRRAPA